MCVQGITLCRTLCLSFLHLNPNISQKNRVIPFFKNNPVSENHTLRTEMSLTLNFTNPCGLINQPERFCEIFVLRMKVQVEQG